jgi:hypothetical protein
VVKICKNATTELRIQGSAVKPKGHKSLIRATSLLDGIPKHHQLLASHVSQHHRPKLTTLKNQPKGCSRTAQPPKVFHKTISRLTRGLDNLDKIISWMQVAPHQFCRAHSQAERTYQKKKKIEYNPAKYQLWRRKNKLPALKTHRDLLKNYLSAVLTAAEESIR